jgi:hypothetical protein
MPVNQRIPHITVSHSEQTSGPGGINVNDQIYHHSARKARAAAKKRSELESGKSDIPTLTVTRPTHAKMASNDRLEAPKFADAIAPLVARRKLVLGLTSGSKTIQEFFGSLGSEGTGKDYKKHIDGTYVHISLTMHNCCPKSVLVYRPAPFSM